LKSKGYYTDNLWQIDDVKGKFECDDDEAQEVLDNAFNNEATYDQIWLSIEYAGEHFGLEQKDDSGTF
jgi:frataxin-like iron-binding protein CyaY